ncbi:MAG: 4a-hydroxytetrahydrobiopterin dehydratase [Verrucomicrobia bacterium]|nr:4a-hydroxytetrahydrobiopterin dehydratase [Verrucomicrobiota bacterium]
MGSKELAKKTCTPCAAGIAPMKGDALKEWELQLGEGWAIVEEHHLEKEYRFKNFLQALEFTNDIGKIAEAEGHHPEITLSWGKVKVMIWTHKIGGLAANDFILAAKCDTAYLIRHGT